jgi:hypothetical protein
MSCFAPLFSKQHISIIQTKSMETVAAHGDFEHECKRQSFLYCSPPQVWNNQGLSWLYLVGIQISPSRCTSFSTIRMPLPFKQLSIGQLPPRRMSSNRWTDVVFFPFLAEHQGPKRGLKRLNNSLKIRVKKGNFKKEWVDHGRGSPRHEYGPGS